MALVVAACSNDPHWVITTPKPGAPPPAPSASLAAASPTAAPSAAPSPTPPQTAESAAPPSPTLAAEGADKVTLSEFRISLQTYTVTAGKVTFTVTNGGGITHEFVIKKTDLQDDKLPLAEDGTVNEDAPELGQVGEVPDLEVGLTQTLEVDLVPGNYVFFCNLPTHYASGMHGTFTVAG
ncbi:MAG: plastocyanin/azurin family copper-binding protein [Chloroflexota bacterium]